MSHGPFSSPRRNLMALVGVVALVLVFASVAIFHKKRVEVVRQETERAERIEGEKKEAEEAVRAEKEVARQQLREEQTRLVKQREEEVERETLVRTEQKRVEEARRAQEDERRRTATEKARREREEQLAEQERLAAAREKEEEQRRRAAEQQAQREAEEQAKREEEQRRAADEAAKVQAAAAAVPLDEEDDDTPDVETDSTIDGVEERKGWGFDGDLRPIYDYFDLDARDGDPVSEDEFGVRWRLGAQWGVARGLRLGARLAGLCFVGDCDFDFVMQQAAPLTGSGLAQGQFTFDQLYVHGFRKERFDVAVGRLQTRFVLRTGVYAKSLDRNDSNNVNVTWTDGIHATYRGIRSWAGHFVLQRNSADGSGSIRRGLLDFDDSSARNTYFVAFENLNRWGPVVQRGLDVSYLPSSLLKDGDPNGRREDYWAAVGRLVVRWPQRPEGFRLRTGAEVGYAPNTPTAAAVDLPGSGDVSGLAWNIVVSAMDFMPDHSIGLNYAQTGPAWYLSPQFRPNEELIEIRYQWRPARFPLLEARIRRRQDLDQLLGTTQKRNVLDGYIRLTWEFTIKDF